MAVQLMLARQLAWVGIGVLAGTPYDRKLDLLGDLMVTLSPAYQDALKRGMAAAKKLFSKPPAPDLPGSTGGVQGGVLMQART